MGLTQIYHVGNELHFELNDGSVANFLYGKHKEGLLGLLYDLSKELDRVPTFEDVLNHPKMPHPNTFAFYFGSFDKAAEAVESKIRFQRWREEHKASEATTSTSPKEKLESQDKELRKEGDEVKRRKWTKGEILTLVIKKEKELGHFPTLADFNTDSELPSYPTIANKFGGIRELKGEVEDRKERQKKLAERSESEVAAATQKIMNLIGKANETEVKTEEPVVEELTEAIEEPVEVAKELAAEPEEAVAADEQEEKDEPEVVCESEPVAEEKEPEAIVEVNENGATGPVQATVEVKEANGQKIVRIHFTLEISFPK